jgi:acetyl-CoA carboxylase alpha subunit
VIAPEGAAAILYRDSSRAPEVAERLKLTASDIVQAGIADAIVPEPAGGASADPDGAAARLRDAIVSALDSLSPLKQERLLEERFNRYRSIGAAYVRERPIL